MAADALATQVARSSAAMILTTWNGYALAFLDRESLQLKKF